MIIRNVLSNDKSAIKTISHWLWSEWGNPNNETFWYSWVESSTMNKNDIPQTFVGIINEQIVGTISLWRCDLQSRQDLFPWLGGLYVDEKYRNQGIGKKLVDHACNVAAHLGYSELFLFSELINYYEKLEWDFLCSVPDENGNIVSLYRKELKNEL